MFTVKNVVVYLNFRYTLCVILSNLFNFKGLPIKTFWPQTKQNLENVCFLHRKSIT